MITNEFFCDNTLKVCEKLIGSTISCHTINGEIVAIINEIEAYLGVNDKACHSYGGRYTNRTKVMYKEGGVLYIYLNYGLHYNINFVTSKKGDPCAILLRGVKVIKGHDVASLNRYGKKYSELNNYQIKNLSNGPGKVSQMFKINLNQNGKKFNEVFNVTLPTKPQKFITTKRVGVEYAQEDALLPYRYILIE